MAGMAIREWVPSVHLAMPFANIREWSGPPEELREGRRFLGSTEQYYTKNQDSSIDTDHIDCWESRVAL